MQLTRIAPLGIALEKPLADLEKAISRKTDQADAEEPPRHNSHIVLFDGMMKNTGRPEPEYPKEDDGDGHKEEHVLDVETDTDEITRPVCLCIERVESRRHALEESEADDVHGGEADACGAQIIGAQTTGDDGCDDGGRVLEEVGR